MFSGPRWSQSARTISEKDRERDRDRDWDRHRNSKRPEPSGPRRQSTTLPVREKARGTRDEPRRKSTGRSQSPPAVRRPSKEDWGKRSGQQHSKAPPRRSSSAERWPAQDVRTVVVTLRDLSYRRKDIVLHLAPTDTLGPAEELLRRRFAEPGRATERIRDGEHIAFYFRGEEIVHDAALGESDETTAKKWRIIFYRVSEDRANADQWPNSDSDSESESDDGSDVREQEYGTHGGELRITHLRRGRHVDATGELRRCVLEAINAGKTIGELRTAVAIALGVPDPYRIVLVARGGMRPGALQGNEWQAQHMKSWLPDRLAIEVCPRRCYLILRGLGREYVYQPPFPETPKTHVAIPDIQRWMERRLLTAVHQYAESEVVVRPSRIELSFRGKPLGPKAKNVSWGDIVHFDLPDGVAEVFEREETWLLAPTETCAVCGEDKRVTEMPRRITARCEHLPTTCKDCLAQWIDSSMDTVTWDQLRCPECPRHLKYQDVQAFASRKTFEKYDAFAFRAALGKMPNFFFCLDERCGSGHIHDKGCARFVCSDCGSKACINHEIPWHRGETCEQYDKRNEKRREDEKKSKKFIKKTSKRCPRCKRDVFKYAGCNHITCKSLAACISPVQPSVC